MMRHISLAKGIDIFYHFSAKSMDLFHRVSTTSVLFVLYSKYVLLIANIVTMNNTINKAAFGNKENKKERERETRSY